MPYTPVVLYQDEQGTVPLLEWFRDLPPKAIVKCRLKIERLQELGHELRRPEADYLRDGIHELRTSLQGRQYRILYFFHQGIAAVVSHGVSKERRVPPKEIERAIARKKEFEQNPKRYTYEEG